MDEVRNLGHNVFIACGRAILVRDASFDADDPGSREMLIRTGRGAFKEKWDRPRYGDMTVVTLGPDLPGPFGGHGRAMGEMHMRGLPDDVREQLRKEFPDHAAEI